jgi:4-diphosphocytidyl-2-C-methyl-D-erythritol kinase
MSFVLNAPAKINWFLSVTGRRDDGYHNIQTLMQCIGLYDSITFAEDSNISVSCSMPELSGEDNLVLRAAKLLRERTGTERGARLLLEKHIPVAAGLGGGSSDAAYTLIGLDRLWNTGLDRKSLSEIGAEIGSDVPFFIDDVCAVAEGRGEVITSIPAPPVLDLLLVNPGIPVSSGWAYRSLQIGLTKKPVDIKLFCQSLDRKDFDSLRSLLVNDLEIPVIERHPVIGRIRESLYEHGAVAAAMSGSGSTVFGLFRTEDDARNASVHMAPYWCRAVKTLIDHELLIR